MEFLRTRTRTAALGVAIATTATLFVGGTAQAAPAQTRQSDVSVQDYIPGKDVVVGQCKGWLNKRASDGYVQAVAQSWNNHECVFVLQRKRLGSGGYDWTTVSDTYRIMNEKKATGYHWNGTNAGSRVCLWNYTTGGEDCGEGAW
ncbi:hypothetical protein OQI_29430 [Streptomyces pharetrae CZA14]|uniref:Secreted protein n=1 Tax=Streptomyces pharetrae CZA14 TaxID=1144883 RepID=A0ABX3YBP5_9ACTN|nr:hypothetical protein OQI_29430 [Streptomyces pharetrae CZA14]